MESTSVDLGRKTMPDTISNFREDCCFSTKGDLMSTINDSYGAEEIHTRPHYAPSVNVTGSDAGQSGRRYGGVRNRPAERLTSDKIILLTSSLRVGDALVFICIGLWASTAYY